MITELAVERVEFTCGHCWHQWSCDYDVQRYTDETGRDWEYFALDGHPAESPYTPSGAQPCPDCGRHWVGRVLARRPIPTPPGLTAAPRQQVTDPAGHRPERHHAPMLGAHAHAHTQPDQMGPPAADDWDTEPEPEPSNAHRELG